jgi:formylmethanofuran dehydrogenase subunit E
MVRYSRGEITSEEAEHIAQYLAGRTTEKKPGIIDRTEKEIEDIDEMEKHKIFDFKKVRVEQFIEPNVCEGCHSEIFEDVIPRYLSSGAALCTARLLWILFGVQLQSFFSKMLQRAVKSLR